MFLRQAFVRALAIACAATCACGARTDLGGGKKTGAASECVPSAPAAHCSGWTFTQSTVFWQAPPMRALQIGGVLQTGCDALAIWASWDANGGPSAWTSQTLDFGGFVVGDGPVTHASLSATIDGTPSFSMAQNGGRVGALETDQTGCRFLQLDEFGHETSSAVSLGAPGCASLAADGDSFSFLRADPDGLSPITLTKLDTSGNAGGTTTLALPDGQVSWDRTAFADGSFLVYTFLEDLSTADDTGWLTPFDATGSALGPELTVSDVATAPVTVVPTSNGALGAWTWRAGMVRPLDRHGAQTGPDVNVTGDASVYGTLLLPTPDGDVLYVWTQYDDSATFSLHGVALAPDRTPRAPAIEIDHDVEDARLFGAVESTGKRALLVRATSAGIEARSLACVP